MHQVKIEELSNGLKITDTIDGVVVVRELSSYAFPFIRSTNEAGETYQVVDTNGEIYNLPAVPSEFLLINLNLQSYTPGTGTELIEDSYHLKPFRKDDLEDRIISIGEVTASTSIANLGLDVSGVNSVFINGNLREKYLADSFSFTPTVTGLKMLIIYAKDDAQIFYMAEGVEGPEAVEPAYTGLFVARLIVSTSGPIIDQPETDNTFKLQAEDTWRNIVINSDTAQQIVIASVPSASFNILVTDLSSAPKINGFRTKNQKNTRDGLEVKLYNDSTKPIEFIASSTSTVGDATTYGIKAGFILAPATFAEMVRKNDLYEILPAGEVFDPSVLQAQIDTLDSDLDAEIVNRALADTNLQNQLNAANLLIADLRVPQITITTATAITTDTLSASSRSQHGKNVIIDNGVNAIPLQCLASSPANFCASYSRLGAGAVTITAGIGVTVEEVYSGSGKVCNGAVMSSFTLERVGTKFYLKLNNA